MPKRRSILFAASECAPFVKAGGLGDVVGALPAALQKLGHDVRIVLPRYGFVSTKGMKRHDAPLGVPLGAGEAWAGVVETRLPGTEVPVYFLEHDALFGRPYIYDPPGGLALDSLSRFAFLSRGALQLCKYLAWIPDVVHVHDWPTALVPVYMHTLEAAHPIGRAASVLTIHNVAHQAKFDAKEYAATQLPWSEMRADSLEDYGAVSPLKGGLFHATKLVAVSPRYAYEIRTPEGGAGLDGLLRFRGGDLLGILNGIDEDVWDPRTDAAIAAPFDADDLSGKAACKRALQREMGIAEIADVPLIGIVSRLTAQKGSDVIADALPRILALGAQVVVLGAGAPALEARYRATSEAGGDRMRAWIGYSDGLAHRIEAGSDLFLMPSRFEPCGLNQMYSQRYGTLPIVRATGGLVDTVESYDAATGEGTGFVLDDLDVDSLVATTAWAIATYRDAHAFRAMQRRAMKKHFGWNEAAARYADVYEWAIARRGG
jgi:starch synthase